MPALSRVQLCNMALVKIRAGKITTFEEASIEAGHCRIFYPQVMAMMLETFDFSFAKQRSVLVAVANDRPQEWVYAYTQPANMAGALQLLPDFEGLGLGLPIPLLGEPYAEVWAPGLGTYFEMPYIIEGRVIYCNVENATLAYTIDDVSGLPLSALVAEAISTELGAKLAVPVKGDGKREKDLAAASELCWHRALAEDRNRQPTMDDQYESEAMMARRGLAC
jgi:hypothetical protein